MTDDDLAGAIAEGLDMIDPDGILSDEEWIDGAVEWGVAEYEAEQHQDTREQATARELANSYREAGDYARAGELFEYADGPSRNPQAVELATSAVSSALDRVMHASAGRAQAIAQQNAEPAVRRRSGSSPADDRLAIALSQISDGTYDAAARIELASPSAAASELARHRWNPAAQVVGGMPCGSADAFGRCAAPYHDAECSSLADPEIITPALREQMAAKVTQPAADSRGYPWRDQHGQGMGLAAHIEAASGVRTRREGLFETGYARPELPQAQRVMRIGDYDDPDDRGQSLHSAQADARHIAVQLGLGPDRTADQARAEGIERAAQAAVSRGRGMLPADTRWDMSGRREQHHRPVQPVPVSDDLMRGELPAYRAG